MAVQTSANAASAAVVRKKGGPFVIEKLRLGEPRDDEVLVRIVATGMCHTDMVVRDQIYPVPQPIVLGHEGAGVVGSPCRQSATRRPCGPLIHVLRSLPALRTGTSGQLRQLQRTQFQRCCRFTMQRNHKCAFDTAIHPFSTEFIRRKAAYSI